MLLPAVAAEEGRVEPRFLIVGSKRWPSSVTRRWALTTQRRIDVAGAGNEAVQLERHECPVAGTAAFACRPAHQDEHACSCERQRASSRPVCSARRLAASAMVMGWRRDSRCPSSSPISSSIQTASGWRRSASSSRDSGSSHRSPTASRSPRVAGLSAGSVARSRLSSMTASVPIVRPEQAGRHRGDRRRAIGVFALARHGRRGADADRLRDPGRAGRARGAPASRRRRPAARGRCGARRAR